MSKPTSIALAQIDIAFADREKNLARMIAVLDQTASKGAKLAVFPEAALSGYCYNSPEEARPHAEPIPGPSTQRLTEICKKLDVYVIYGLIESTGERLFNSTALVGPQ